jgi:ABC-type molybdate transport system substrate-binding protein
MDLRTPTPGSPTKMRAQSLFITQKNIDINLSQIQQHHNDLNKYIENIELRVHERVEKNEAEIIMAYKNHINLVKKDMEALKRESQAQASNSNSFVETIEYLEKKLAIFRDEALRLFEKLDEKETEL